MRMWPFLICPPLGSHITSSGLFFCACLVRICVFPALTIHFLNERWDLSPRLMTRVLHRLNLGFTSHPKDVAPLWWVTHKSTPALPGLGIEPRPAAWQGMTLTTELHPLGCDNVMTRKFSPVFQHSWWPAVQVSCSPPLPKPANNAQPPQVSNAINSSHLMSCYLPLEPAMHIHHKWQASLSIKILLVLQTMPLHLTWSRVPYSGTTVYSHFHVHNRDSHIHFQKCV